MSTCMCCQKNHMKPTCSFFCRNCYIALNRKSGLSVKDYIVYFENMYGITLPNKTCKYKSLTEIHKHFLCYLHITDTKLVELLEAILFLKVDALNWKSFFYKSIYIEWCLYRKGWKIKYINTSMKGYIIRL